MIPTKTEEEAAPAVGTDAVAEAHMAALRARLSTRPVATLVLLAVLVAVFAVELLLGGSESVPVLNALGGLNHDAVSSGQVWRIVSHSFLHASFVHIGLNGWVLYVVGQRVEQMLGTARTIVFYTVAVVGGGVMAFFTSSAVVTVGASGGLFGLLAAESIFVFTSRSHLLPPLVRAARQRGAVINLLLNLGISLQPNVSLSAHAGGAIVGAGLMLLGFAPHAEDATTKAPPFVRMLAVGSTVLLGVSLACGLALSGATALLAGPTLVRTPIPALGWSAELPASLAAHEEASATGAVIEQAFGEIQRDPALVAIARIPRDEPSTPVTDEASMTQLETALATPPSQTTVQSVRRTTCGDRPALVARYSYPSGVVLQRYLVVRATDIARIDTLAWPAFEAAYTATAAQTASSIQPL
jgi:rhomboid protease GluP